MIPYGSLVVYVTPRRMRRHIKRLLPNQDWHSNDGALSTAAVAAANYGDVVKTSEGVPILVERATLVDLLMGIKRQTQIIYPKDIAWICLKLGIGPGAKVLEAGCGSGGLTLALSWFCGPTGQVISHDARPEFVKLARRNLDWAGLGANVELHERDIAQGFAAIEADALFLDMREPWLHLDKIPTAVKRGAMVGFLLPTAPQVSQLLAGLETGAFGEIEVHELLLRAWKPLADRLRPQDRMAAHTGFLVFCRQQKPCPEFAASKRQGTRERKQQAALDARLADRKEQKTAPDQETALQEEDY